MLLAALGAGLYVFTQASDDGGKSGGATLAGAPTSLANRDSGETGTGPLDSRAPVVGQPAPDFALKTVDGDTVRLSDLRGKVVWINFWATWCRPCKKELPDIQKLYDEYRNAGLEVLAVNWKDDPGDASAYFDDAGLSLPLLLDRGGNVYDQYRLQGLPDSFFVDRDGNLAALHFGFLSEEKMRERLATAGLP